MEAEQIKDLGALGRWLSQQPVKAFKDIYLRATLRVIPVLIQQSREILDGESDKVILSYFRAILIALVARDDKSRKIAIEAETAGVRMTYSDHLAFPSHQDDGRRPTYNASMMVLGVPGLLVEKDKRHRIRGASTNIISSDALIAGAFGQVIFDASAVEMGIDIRKQVLWTPEAPLAVRQDWRVIEDRWSEDGQGWKFWLRWYQSVLDGTPQNPDLLRDIALIPDDDWKKGEAHMAGLIEKLEQIHPRKLDEEDAQIDEQLAALPPPSTSKISKVKTAVQRSQADLPPTMDAIFGYIGLEIARLQGRNYHSDDERDESQRQIGVLRVLHSAIARLQVILPQNGQITDSQAIQTEKLTRLYVRKFAEWPRSNADELVDNMCRAALVGLTAALLPMLGVSSAVAVSAGIVIFGGKKIVDGIKASKDLIATTKP